MKNFFENKTILVVAPHADDESIGCGGIIAKAIDQGAQVNILVVSVGDLQRVGGGDQVRTGVERVDEVERVRAYFGAHDAEVLKTDSESHMRLDAIPRRDLVALLERDARLSVRNVKPDIVLLPLPSYNQDHEAVCRAGLVACRPHDPRALPVPPIVLLYEYPPNSWVLPPDRFDRTFYVDISDYLDKKLGAVALYESQARDGLHQNTVENIRDLALVRGKEASVRAAEAFHTLRFTC